MVRLSLAKLAAGFGSIAFALTAATGVASADPMDPVINTTCNYGQVMAALNATDPASAAKLSSNPLATNWLSSFLAAGPAERQQKAQELQSYPGASKYVGLVQRVAGICNNY
jgi:hemophore-related protein